ncbi:type A chloramphenicol O-acetyltransferase [Massiliimalia timonensis]|uniref:type A chloramphenicol O-acetyltransferase n=1 Tax=Massiliimalia timonensis TaxID=1987501 RepID=UPI000B8B3FEE|nr:type A chloramphenicol O-acetyltransferase [Massiliimalia timonensis]
MEFHRIDLEQYPRKEHYWHYRQAVPCTYSMTVTLDMTHMLQKIKEKGFPFYPVIIYGISRVVNAHQEFRMALDELGRLGYYDVVHPNYTIFHPKTETFSSLWTPYQENLSAFLRQYQENLVRYGDQPTAFSPMPDIPNQFFISCIPWVSFTEFHLNIQHGYNHFAPIFTIGKYQRSGEKILLPLAVQVHHAACDGFHTARLTNELQAWADYFSLPE